MTLNRLKTTAVTLLMAMFLMACGKTRVVFTTDTAPMHFGALKAGTRSDPGHFAAKRSVPPSLA